MFSSNTRFGPVACRLSVSTQYRLSVSKRYQNKFFFRSDSVNSMSQTPLNGCTRFKEVERSEAIQSAIGCNLEVKAGVGFTSKQATRSGSIMDCGCQVGSSFHEMKRTLRLTVNIARTPIGACSFSMQAQRTGKKCLLLYLCHVFRA